MLYTLTYTVMYIYFSVELKKYVFHYVPCDLTLIPVRNSCLILISDVKVLSNDLFMYLQSNYIIH